ncbi:hypothetical protein PYCC9005_000188 [Savitreella phatthalungensis]
MLSLFVLVIVYGALLAVCALGAIGWVRRMRDAQESSAPASVTTFVLFVATAGLVLLPALDTALVASLNDRSTGALKSWASSRVVNATTGAVAWTYVGFAILSAVLILFAVPFSYAFFEDGDYELIEDGHRTSQKTGRALKYAIGMTVTAGIIFLLGLFLPSAKEVHGPVDGDYLKGLLEHARPIKALLFVLGIVLIGGAASFAVYGGIGLAALPMGLIRAASPQRRLALASASRDLEELRIDLDLNRRRQRHLNLRASRTEREDNDLERLRNEERDIEGAIRLASEPAEGQAGPAKVVVGLAHGLVGLLSLIFAALLVWSFLATWLRTLLDSRACGPGCGFLDRVPASFLANPLPTFLNALPKPVAFATHLVVALVVVAALLSGLATYGVRFLFFSLFPVSANATPPQGLLLGGTLLLLAAYGYVWSGQNLIFSGYARYGGQMFCSGISLEACAKDRSLIRPCSELITVTAQSLLFSKHGGNKPDFSARNVCIESVTSRISTTLAANYPILNIAVYWVQPAVVVVWFLSLFYTTCSRSFGRPAPTAQQQRSGAPDERTRLV